MGRPLDRMFIVENGAIVAHISPDANANRPRALRDTKTVMVRNSIPLHARRDILKGNCVGHEMIHKDAVAEYYATTVVMSEIHTLLKEDYLATLDLFPETKAMIAKFTSRKNWMRMKLRADEKQEEDGKVAIVAAADQTPDEIVADLRQLKSRFQDVMQRIRVKDQELQRIKEGKV